VADLRGRPGPTHTHLAVVLVLVGPYSMDMRFRRGPTRRSAPTRCRRVFMM